MSTLSEKLHPTAHETRSHSSTQSKKKKRGKKTDDLQKKKKTKKISSCILKVLTLVWMAERVTRLYEAARLSLHPTAQETCSQSSTHLI